MASAAPVLAADLGAPAAPTSNPFAWTGFFAGAQIGYGWGDAAVDRVFDHSPDGLLGGLQAGYSHQFASNVVLGVDMSFSLANLSASSTLHYVKAPVEVYEWSATRVENFSTIKGRAGYAFGDVLPYVTGGLALATLKTDHRMDGMFAGTPADAEIRDSRLHTGWTVGAGVEYAVTPKITTKIEYLYSDLGTKDYAARYSVLPDQFSAPVDLTLQTVTFGVNYRF